MVRYRIVRTLLSFGTFPFPPSLLFTDLLAPRADFLYIVPPFLAYYGADTQNALVLPQSYTQCQLFPASPPTFEWRSVDAHHGSPKPRHRTVVNGERVGRSWDDARPRYVHKNGNSNAGSEPANWHDTTPYTSGRTEGQNFVVLMYAGWRDCVYAEVCGNPLAPSSSSGSGGTTTTGSATAGAATTTTAGNSRRMAKKRMHGGVRRALDIFDEISG